MFVFFRRVAVATETYLTDYFSIVVGRYCWLQFVKGWHLLTNWASKPFLDNFISKCSGLKIRSKLTTRKDLHIKSVSSTASQILFDMSRQCSHPFWNHKHVHPSKQCLITQLQVSFSESISLKWYRAFLNPHIPLSHTQFCTPYI